MLTSQVRRLFSKVSIEDVKKLRELTSAPMSDCKKALIESNNDIAEAKKILIKKNLIFSEKKVGREQKEGVWGFKTNSDRTKAVLVNLTCETDFVAKSQAFVNFCSSTLTSIVSAEDFVTLDSRGESDEVKAWMEKTGYLNTSDNLIHAKKLLIANTQENIEFSRIHTIQVENTSKIGYYIHKTISESVGSSGNYVVVNLDSKVDQSAQLLKQTIDNLAVHCFSLTPKYLYETALPREEYLEIETTVRQSMAKAIEGKPEAL
jgi:elongation factor Ts